MGHPSDEALPAPKKVIADLRDLKSKAAQDALDEMILKTLRQMTDEHGQAPEAALKRLNVCRGGFTYAQAILLQALLSTK